MKPSFDKKVFASAALLLSAFAEHSAVAIEIGEFHGEQIPILLTGPIDQFMDQPLITDLDRDGRQEIIFFHSSTESFVNPEADPDVLHILANDDQGQFKDIAAELFNGPIPQMQLGARHTIAHDFNGDGLLDLFFGGHGPEPEGGPDFFPGGQNRLALSQPDGRYVDVTETHLPQHTDFTHGMCAGDFDLDGDLDIWVNNLGAGDVPWPYMLHNDGAGRFDRVADIGDQDHPNSVGANGILPDGIRWPGFWPFCLDVEGDGDVDILLGPAIRLIDPLMWWNDDAYIPGVYLWLNDGQGRFDFAPQHPFEMPDWDGRVEEENSLTWDVSDSTVHDLDGDGLEDLIFRQGIFMNNGNGTFRLETEARFPGTNGETIDEVMMHDLDGDGHMDTFRGIRVPSDDMEVRVNDGEGYFRALPPEFVSESLSRAVVADLDGDGGSDIFYHIGDNLYHLFKMIKPYGPDLEGTASEDRLIGGALDNHFQGKAGNDVLDSGLGDDVLNGGPGDDELIGGKGDDTYVYHAADRGGDDVIRDKAGFDRIRFEGFSTTSISNARQDESGNLVLEFSSGGSITIEGQFQQGNYGVEYLQVGEDTFPLSRNPSFTEGNISELMNPFFINAGVNDAWVSMGAPYQGIFFTAFPTLKLFFAAWFTFDSVIPPTPFTATFGMDDQRWATGSGIYSGNHVELNMELTTGGRFNTSAPLATQDHNFGTMIIDFSHCNLAGVQYDFPGAGESGFMTVSRVIESNVPLCEMLNTE